MWKLQVWHILVILGKGVTGYSWSCWTDCLQKTANTWFSRRLWHKNYGGEALDEDIIISASSLLSWVPGQWDPLQRRWAAFLRISAEVVLCPHTCAQTRKCVHMQIYQQPRTFIFFAIIITFLLLLFQTCLQPLLWMHRRVTRAPGVLCHGNRARFTCEACCQFLLGNFR